ncbi:MAG: glycosyltransferase family 4 protein [Thermoanaerobaculia bacterium]
MTTRVIVLSPEPIRERMAGMGIRALKIAECLRDAGHDVALAAPPADGPEFVARFEVVSYGTSAFRSAARQAGLAVVSGHSGLELAETSFDGALVADLYDPFLIENLAYRSTLGAHVFENDRRALFALLARADLILAATQEQRLFYLGLLLGRDLLDPDSFQRDPEAHRTVAIAPFGVDEAPPADARPDAKIGKGIRDVLFGGIYDWYDPDLVLDAWHSVLRAVPEARLLFSESPNAASTPQAAYLRTRARADAEGWNGRSVCFVPWTDHAARGGFYRSCRVGIVAHRSSLETDLSFRTRMLDFLWAGLPIVTTPGGAGAALIERSGAGSVAGANPEAISAALVELLTDERRWDECSSRALAAAGDFGWSRVLSPLLHFAANPWRASRPKRKSGLMRGAAGLRRRMTGER